MTIHHLICLSEIFSRLIIIVYFSNDKVVFDVTLSSMFNKSKNNDDGEFPLLFMMVKIEKKENSVN